MHYNQRFMKCPDSLVFSNKLGRCGDPDEEFDNLKFKKDCLGPSFGPFCTKFVYPRCWHFDNGKKRKINVVLTEHGGLPHVLPLAVFLGFFWWTSRGDHYLTP